MSRSRSRINSPGPVSTHIPTASKMLPICHRKCMSEEFTFDETFQVTSVDDLNKQPQQQEMKSAPVSEAREYFLDDWVVEGEVMNDVRPACKQQQEKEQEQEHEHEHDKHVNDVVEVCDIQVSDSSSEGVVVLDEHEEDSTPKEDRIETLKSRITYHESVLTSLKSELAELIPPVVSMKPSSPVTVDVSNMIDVLEEMVAIGLEFEHKVMQCIAQKLSRAADNILDLSGSVLWPKYDFTLEPAYNNNNNN